MAIRQLFAQGSSLLRTPEDAELPHIASPCHMRSHHDSDRRCCEQRAGLPGSGLKKYYSVPCQQDIRGSAKMYGAVGMQGQAVPGCKRRYRNHVLLPGGLRKPFAERNHVQMSSRHGSELPLQSGTLAREAPAPRSETPTPVRSIMSISCKLSDRNALPNLPSWASAGGSLACNARSHHPPVAHISELVEKFLKMAKPQMHAPKNSAYPRPPGTPAGTLHVYASGKP